MATAAAFNKHVECSVCMEVYRKPHVLSCLHTYCLECLSQINKYGKVECPECRQVTDFSKIKKDFKTQGLVETYHAETNGKAVDAPRDKVTKLKCQVCKRKVVTSRCEECEKFLCVDCETAHTGSRSTRHHVIQPLKQLIDSYKDDIQDMIERLRNYVEHVDTKLAVIDKNAKSVEHLQSSQTSQVNRYFEELVEKIKQHHEGVLEIITESNCEASDFLLQNQDILKQQKSDATEKMTAMIEVEKGYDTDALSDLAQADSDFNSEMKGKEKQLSVIQTCKTSNVKLIYGDDIDPRKLLHVKVYEIPSPSKVLILPAWRNVRSQHSTINYQRMALAQYKQEQYIKQSHKSSSICLMENELWCVSSDRLLIFDLSLNEISRSGMPNAYPTDTYQMFGLVKMTNDNAIMACRAYDIYDDGTPYETGLFQIDRKGKQICQISEGWYTSIDYYNNTLYALDSSNNNVAVFKYNIGEWENAMEFYISDQLSSTSTLSINANGIFISVPQDECIYVYSLKGEHLEVIANPHHRSGFTCELICGVDSEKNMLMCEVGGGRLAVYDHNRQWHVIDLMPPMLNLHYHVKTMQCIVSADMNTLWINVKSRGDSNALYKYNRFV